MTCEEERDEAFKVLGILVREHYGPPCFCTEHWVRGHTGDCGEWHDARTKAIKLIGHYGMYHLSRFNAGQQPESGEVADS